MLLIDSIKIKLYRIYTNAKMELLLDRMMKMGGMMVGAGFFASNCLFVVDGGERALKMNAFRGLLPTVYGEGMHFRIPVIDKINRFEIRTRP